ncbi:hypothetical protein FQA47_015097 [Oryzias melastigma]|uniref:Uncharacterized protein n=1 Tax=Oryzias melastigma TaxID=30732 RepID=A0A834C0H2_ORYME|nr:hypothetical protein FQA47_015097 [Oryzias melastigma]
MWRAFTKVSPSAPLAPSMAPGRNTTTTSTLLSAEQAEERLKDAGQDGRAGGLFQEAKPSGKAGQVKLGSLEALRLFQETSSRAARRSRSSSPSVDGGVGLCTARFWAGGEAEAVQFKKRKVCAVKADESAAVSSAQVCIPHLTSSAASSS